MIPGPRLCAASALRKPRASGDDPGLLQASVWSLIVNPARAGMIPSRGRAVSSGLSKPRASGDDPPESGRRKGRPVNPARAGMIPLREEAWSRSLSKPRASGDDPHQRFHSGFFAL